MDRILLPENMFVNLMDLNLQDRIANTDKYDYDIKNTLELLLENGPNSLRQDLEDWQLEKHGNKNILFYKGKNYIPDDLDLQWDIVRMFHDHETAGHLGKLEMYNSVKQHYWWPGMQTFVKQYVQGCGICQQFKINWNLSHPSYLPIEGTKSTRPFASCSMDMIMDLPISGGYDSILAVMDHGLTKGVILIPCNKTLTADQCAQLLLDNIYKQFGLMDKIISDQGPQFAAKSFLDLLKLLKIKSSLTTAYHLQSDGATEWVNQEIEAYISIFCTNNPEEWSTMFSMMEFTHNNQRHADRLNTPFELMLGITLVTIPLAFEHMKYPSIEEKINNLIKIWEEALAAHELERTQMAGRHKDMFIPFQKGQKVWLDSSNLKTSYHKKIRPKCEGLLSYDFPGSFWNRKYAENNSRQERTKSGKDLASTYVLCRLSLISDRERILLEQSEEGGKTKSRFKTDYDKTST